MPDPKKLQQNDSQGGDSIGDRQERYRKNKKTIGLVRKEIWVYPELWPEIKAIIDQFQKNRTANNKEDGKP